MIINDNLQKGLYLLSKAANPLDVFNIWKFLGEDSKDLSAIIALNNYDRNLYPSSLKNLTDIKDSYFIPYFQSDSLYFIDDELLNDMFLNKSKSITFPIDYSIMLDTNYASYIHKFIKNDMGDFSNNIFKTIHTLILKDFNYDYNFYLFENYKATSINGKDIYSFIEQNSYFYNNLVSLEMFKEIDKKEFRENNIIKYLISEVEASNNAEKIINDIYFTEEGKTFLNLLLFTHKQMVLLLIGVYKIQFESNRSPKKKIAELFNYANEVVGAYMDREMIVAYEFFKNRNNFPNLNKVNRSKQQPNLLKKIENIAWDFSVPRLMELVMRHNVGDGRYFIPFFLSYDKGLKDVLKLYNVKGVVFNKMDFFTPLTEITNVEYFENENCDIDFESYFSSESITNRKAKIEYNRKNIDSILENEFNKLVQIL